jgi:uncharacterized membrane protein YhaH (DUF805 family)
VNKGADRGLFEAIGLCFSKYGTFTGRAARWEFWWWTLFQFLIAAAFDSMVVPQEVRNLAHATANGGVPPLDATHATVQLIGSLFSLVLFLPSLAVTVRRLHDIGRSGWWYLFGIIPIVGWITMLVWFCRKGTDGDNRFGADPLQEVFNFRGGRRI